MGHSSGRESKKATCTILSSLYVWCPVSLARELAAKSLSLCMTSTRELPLMTLVPWPVMIPLLASPTEPSSIRTTLSVTGGSTSTAPPLRSSTPSMTRLLLKENPLMLPQERLEPPVMLCKVTMPPSQPLTTVMKRILMLLSLLMNTPLMNLTTPQLTHMVLRPPLPLLITFMTMSLTLSVDMQLMKQLLPHYLLLSITTFHLLKKPEEEEVVDVRMEEAREDVVVDRTDVVETTEETRGDQTRGMEIGTSEDKFMAMITSQVSCKKHTN